MVLRADGSCGQGPQLIPLILTVDSGSNLPLLVPNERVFQTRRKAQCTISGWNGDTNAPSFEGGVGLTFQIYSVAKFQKFQYEAGADHQKNKMNKLELQWTSTNEHRESVMEELRLSKLSTVKRATRLNQFHVLDEQPKNIYVEVEASCNRKSNMALVSVGFISENFGLRSVLDHEFPHMVGKDPNYVIPLLTQDRLFYLPTVTYERGCNNPNCRHCLEYMRTPPNEDEVDKVMKSYNFEEAKWAVMSRAKEVKTTMALENSRRKTDLIRWHTPFEYNMKEAVAGNVQEVFQGREQRSTLEEAGEQFRRKTKMKELGVKKFGSNDKHHLRTRRIGLKEAHRLFGHVGMDEETLIATLNSGCTTGLHYVKGESHDKMDCDGCKHNSRKRPNAHESTDPYREERLNSPIQPFSTMFADLSGPMTTGSIIEGYRWYLPIACGGNSGMVLDYGLRKKSDSWKVIKPALEEIKSNGHEPKLLRTDTDSVFKNSKIGGKPTKFQVEWDKQCLRLFGKKVIHRTSLHKSNNNQIAEHTIGHTFVAANAMCQQAAFTSAMWWEAILSYRSTSKCVVKPRHWHPERRTKSPYEIFHRRKPDLYYNLVFGTSILVVDPDSRSKHMKSRLRKGSHVYLRQDPEGQGVAIALDLLVKQRFRTTHYWNDIHSLDKRRIALLDLTDLDAKNKLSRRARIARKALGEAMKLSPDEQPRDVFIMDDDMVLVEIKEGLGTGHEHLELESEATTLPKERIGETFDLDDDDEILEGNGGEYFDNNGIIQATTDIIPDQMTFPSKDHVGQWTEAQKHEMARMLRDAPKQVDDELRATQKRGLEQSVGRILTEENRRSYDLYRGKTIGNIPRERDLPETRDYRLEAGEEFSDSSEDEAETNQRQVMSKMKPTFKPGPKRSARGHSRLVQHQLPEQIIGRRVEKYFKDYGYYTGIVMTYDSPYYRIQYEDGEEEDLTFNEVIRWLHPEESKLVEPQSEAKIKIVVGGDLLEAEEEIIVHQTNCTSTVAGGLAKIIFERHPAANTYERGEHRELGSISRHDSYRQNERSRIIINMNAQLTAGMPRGESTRNRERQVRLDAFKRCLAELGSFMRSQETRKVAMPYLIGCDLGGGDWQSYREALEEFAETYGVQVILYDVHRKSEKETKMESVGQARKIICYTDGDWQTRKVQNSLTGWGSHPEVRSWKNNRRRKMVKDEPKLDEKRGQSKRKYDPRQVEKVRDLMGQVAEVLSANVNTGLQGYDDYMDASKVLIQALASEEDETPPLGSYMDPDSDDEMPPLVSASDSSDSETDDEGTPRRENRRASSQRSIRRNEPSTGGPNQQCGCENVTGSGVKYEDYIQKGHPERQPSRRTLGRDIFLDGCVQQNAEVSFSRENPYPKCTVCAGKSGKTRWQRYEDYKVATTLNEAKRLGASRVHLQQDLSWDLIQISRPVERAHTMMSSVMQKCTFDLSEVKELREDAPRLAEGIFNLKEMEISNVNSTQEAADLLEKGAVCMANRVENVDTFVNQTAHLWDGLPVQEEFKLLLESWPQYQTMNAMAYETFVPEREEELLNCKDPEEKRLWLQAELDEILALCRQGTFEVVKRPVSGEPPIRTKSFYKAKSDAEGKLSRRKVRFVAKGFLCKEGIHYHFTRATVSDYTSVRFLLAFAMQNQMRPTTFDVANAFVQSDLPVSEQVLVEPPKLLLYLIEMSDELKEYCTLPDYDGPIAFKCLKALYGFKNSPYRFQQKVQAKLCDDLGFTMGIIDENVFIKDRDYDLEEPYEKDPEVKRKHERNKAGDFRLGEKDDREMPIGRIIISTWVDDLLVLTEHDEDLEWLTVKLEETFDLSPGSGEDISMHLGMKIVTDKQNKLIKLSCEKAIDGLIHCLKGQLESKRVYSTPITKDSDMTRRREDEQQITEEMFPYRKVVGMLLHMARTCRFDIVLAVSILSSHLNSVAARHVNAAKRVVYYLKETKMLGLVYDGRQTEIDLNRVKMYCDSDWNGDKDTRCSRSGYAVMYGGAAVEVFSKLQSLQCQSSCQAETVSCVTAVNATVTIRQLCLDLTIPQPGATAIYVDNNALYLNSRSEKQSQQSKHFQDRTEYLRAFTRMGEVQLLKVSTDLNISDMFTKALDPTTFLRLRSTIMGHTTPEARRMCEMEL